MKTFFTTLIIILFCITSCNQSESNSKKKSSKKQNQPDSTQAAIPKETAAKNKSIIIEMEKALLYNDHTLSDVYPYKDTTRQFQWEKIKAFLRVVDSIQQMPVQPAQWGVLQNWRNKNGESPLVKTYRRNEYKNVIDTFGIERYQAAPLYPLNDSITPDRYGLDGMLVKILQVDSSDFVKIATVYFAGEWNIPKKYIKIINDPVIFTKVIFVDRTNQNMATFEQSDSKWLIRSMNPVTTGLHHPPLMKPTPLGIFVLQEKKEKMIYLVDGTTYKGGFAPYANRFSSGGYVHGVPVNLPHTSMIEFSPTLGTTPRSHMCVRTATSHSKFIFDWAPVDESLVIVFD